MSKSVAELHRTKWHDKKNFKAYVLDDDLEKIEMSLKHDIDPNVQFEDLYNYSRWFRLFLEGARNLILAALHVYVEKTNEKLFELLVKDPWGKKLDPNT